MEKTVYDKSNGLWYELRGNYYFPCLTVPAQEERPIVDTRLVNSSFSPENTFQNI